ncbi:TPA: alpha/beta hydrolase, partial [Legionella pneumophila subsp. pneumophila]|nr:alpha/beta hydrolase [Legionella pneumophila subsp. pneumophila]
MVMKAMRLFKGILFTFFGIIFCFNSHAALEHEKLVNYISLGEFSRETAEIALKKMPPLDTLSVHYDL